MTRTITTKPITKSAKSKGWEYIKIVSVTTDTVSYTEYYYISEKGGRYLEHKYKTTWK